MNDKLIKKLSTFLLALSFIYLLCAFIYVKGQPVVAGLVALALIVIAAAFTFRDSKYVVPGLNDSTLLLDVLLLIFCVSIVFLEHKPIFIPMVALALVAAVLELVYLFRSGALRGKTFRQIFDEHLRLPGGLDIGLLAFFLYDKSQEGWAFGPLDYIWVGFLAFDLIHNLITLPARLREEKRLASEYFEQLAKEKEALASVDTESAHLDEEARKLITDRINLIDRLLIGKMSGNATLARKAEREVEKIISDRTSFIESLGLHYLVSHPGAIEKLQQCGLSPYEIGLCCLYYMGYSGKEVKDISDTSIIYHVNSNIRQKLGMKSNDVNLTSYIRDLFDHF